MNEGHAVCGSDEWRAAVRDFIIPFALGDGDLGDDVLEVGPGYGATTDVFRERVPKLTAVEIDPDLAAALSARLQGTNVTVVEGDATALTFDADRFTGATCFAMLHHVPGAERQDRLFAEVARVVRPGGLFVASDSLASEDLRAFHEGDTYEPIDPATLPARLERAGFTAVRVAINELGWAARASAT
jgi:SAM-dependent methyltransferase